MWLGRRATRRPAGPRGRKPLREWILNPFFSKITKKSKLPSVCSFLLYTTKEVLKNQLILNPSAGNRRGLLDLRLAEQLAQLPLEPRRAPRLGGAGARVDEPERESDSFF